MDYFWQAQQKTTLMAFSRKTKFHLEKRKGKEGVLEAVVVYISK